MLGCKLEREKCYRGMANSLNNYYKANNKNSSRMANGQNEMIRQYDS